MIDELLQRTSRISRCATPELRDNIIKAFKYGLKTVEALNAAEKANNWTAFDVTAMSDCYFRRLFAQVYTLGHDLNAGDISDSPSADFQGILNSCGLDWNIHNSLQGSREVSLWLKSAALYF